MAARGGNLKKNTSWRGVGGEGAAPPPRCIGCPCISWPREKATLMFLCSVFMLFLQGVSLQEEPGCIGSGVTRCLSLCVYSWCYCLLLLLLFTTTYCATTTTTTRYLLLYNYLYCLFVCLFVCFLLTIFTYSFYYYYYYCYHYHYHYHYYYYYYYKYNYYY